MFIESPPHARYHDSLYEEFTNILRNLVPVNGPTSTMKSNLFPIFQKIRRVRGGFFLDRKGLWLLSHPPSTHTGEKENNICAASLMLNSNSNLLSEILERLINNQIA